MILSSEAIAKLLRQGRSEKDPLVITPSPDLASLEQSGAASLDLRLGSWFLVMRQTKVTSLNVTEIAKSDEDARRSVKYMFVPFGEDFVLHPGAFVLGATLEWIRLPSKLAAIVTGKSSWGRRGLIIATATGVHPCFTGCLTLEITNLGQVPITIRPGLPICQLFIHRVETTLEEGEDGQFSCKRRPVLGTVKMDRMAQILSGRS